MKPPAPSERCVQRAILTMIAWEFPKTFVTHIPNGGSRHAIEAANLKRDGVKKGMLDLAAYWPGGHGLLEVKRPGFSPSDVSPEQKALINDLREMGHNAAIVSSIDSARETLKLWGAM